MPIPQFLLYCTDEGKFILKLEGESSTIEFSQIGEAVAAARKLHHKAALVVYDAVGRVVMDAVT